MDRADLQLISPDGATTYSFMADFGSGVMEYGHPEYEIKEPYKNDWPEENGEDVYVPASGFKLQGADLTVALCYVGRVGTWSSMYKKIVYTLRTFGLFNVYNPYNEDTYYGCHFSSLTDIDAYSDENAGDIVTYKVKFRITDTNEKRS